MSGSEDGPAADRPEGPAGPLTGDPVIDTALQDVDDLQSAPLAEHHDRLARVHEALHVALERSGDGEPG